ncbi:hypothetical protein Gbro_1055 [Gordonia bronchialis DSM 43247]|jgi:hypothetical protein|uniref:Transmembrane protein n=1 Tax=Gordonia bronchialis (strain ATCC 25592 / DSM 43247 / BCRC 13721 / JCM 3198 / KCTC 3076 / NBRC 16047 / NCTC 10667) TaxID=526226 RepID=D0L4E0_GORB4|nr:hypothetical protein [Gordonia bronchialis]ACY20364.1 hypothetical protein Gbro_1055 [Gordonia bronchialis DSM 43247]MCC3323141.1 hypothetical protein [Gordonia bronchialis]QGS25830.1 hypothetical protein FOB84_18575 [Gordonia bronchialis]UAK37771.1 hypothetical protein K8O93_22305 [Gordonia bronchialis]STQ63169.1 Uncharacterised protein [Gordonia bronchialis]
MDIVEAIGKVLMVGLVLGAGLPALFAYGLRLHSVGNGDENADGTLSAPHPALKVASYLVFAFVALVIVTGILWITRQTIYYYTDIKIFPFGYK